MSNSKTRYASNLTGQTAKRLLRPIERFMEIESAGGMILLVSTFFALLAANFAGPLYKQLVYIPLAFELGGFRIEETLLHMVNDGLMAIFFFMVGLEIKREMMVGELSTPKKASFSIFAAIGGMAAPALIYTVINAGTNYSHAWGVPMATDIAFAVGILTLLGDRVPTPLKIFLLALAIVDDLGAILVIAVFYTSEIATGYLGVAALALFTLYLLNHAGIRHIAFGLTLGFVTWFCFLESGIHATIAGVLLAFTMPAYPLDEDGRRINDRNLLDETIHALHPWVSFLIMPIFAFFNAGVSFSGIEMASVFENSVAVGIALGLVLGNPIGITAMTFVAVKTRVAELPIGVSWAQVASVSCLAGIGFTMSLFISSLAFQGDAIEPYSKIGILLGSALAMIVGLIALSLTLPKKAES